MENSDNLFKLFYEKWQNKFDQIKFILQYFQTYKNFLSKLKIENIVKPENIIATQKEWLSLLENYSADVSAYTKENDFFKPYWIPIQQDAYDIFIDISNNNFPIIETSYIPFEPEHYHKIILFEKTSHLMLAPDENLDIKEFNSVRIEKQLLPIAEQLIEREMLAFSGVISLRKINYDDVFKTTKEKIEINVLKNNIFEMKCNNVKSLIASLLPKELKIEIDSFNLYTSYPIDFAQIKCIRDLSFIISERGRDLVYSYKASFLDYENDYIKFSEGEFFLSTTNKEIASIFVDAYNHMNP